MKDVINTIYDLEEKECLSKEEIAFLFRKIKQYDHLLAKLWDREPLNSIWEITIHNVRIDGKI